MPYFKNDKINYLFIHIPKTGGTSIECYISSKFNIPLNESSFFTNNSQNITTPETVEYKIGHSLQHTTLYEIFKNKNIFNIDTLNLTIFCSVRNPYSRIISDLFFYDLINDNTRATDVFDIIQKYITSTYYDNHNIPQYKFIVDENDQIYKNVIFLKKETLTNQMKQLLGFEDFEWHIQVNEKMKKQYSSFLNNDSINLINTFYKKDFEFFEYHMLLTN